MTREELDEIRAELKAITQGEWAVETDDRQGKAWVISHDYLCDGLWCENGYCSLADATFIAASPARINDLLEEVERLREALRQIAERDAYYGEPSSEYQSIARQALNLEGPDDHL